MFEICLIKNLMSYTQISLNYNLLVNSELFFDYFYAYVCEFVRARMCVCVCVNNRLNYFTSDCTFAEDFQCGYRNLRIDTHDLRDGERAAR